MSALALKPHFNFFSGYNGGHAEMHPDGDDDNGQGEIKMMMLMVDDKKRTEVSREMYEILILRIYIQLMKP